MILYPRGDEKTKKNGRRKEEHGTPLTGNESPSQKKQEDTQ